MQVRRSDLAVGEVERPIVFYERFGCECHERYISTAPDVDDGTESEAAELDIGSLRHPVGRPDARADSGPDGNVVELARDP